MPKGFADDYNAAMGKKQKPSAEIIAQIADCSVQLVYKKLRMGKTPAEIVVEAERWREQQQQFVTGLVVPIEGAIPIHGANGHAGGGLSYAAAQTAKENSLAQLRAIEVEERRGRLIPKDYVKRWTLSFLSQGREILERFPDELADQLAAEGDRHRVKEVLDEAVARVIEAFRKLPQVWMRDDLDQPNG
jgi:hypothetical protein